MENDTSAAKSFLFSDVVLTDQTLDLCDSNMALQPQEVRERDGGNRVHTAVVSWGEDSDLKEVQGRFGMADLVVASDVICHQDEETMKALVFTLHGLLRKRDTLPPGSCVVPHVLVAYEFRDDWFTCGTFTDLCKEAGLEIVESANLEPQDEDSDYLLYVMREA